jgi:glycosyltransferase involved in cell wall biosynthesis
VPRKEFSVTTPLLSVVIPTWNRANLVCQAIESALCQRRGLIEVIVVDDGSTDNTGDELARRFGGSIRVLCIPRRTGVGAARNAGARLASGRFLAFLDSDDIWLPGKLDAELGVFERFPEAEAVVSDSVILDEGHTYDRTWFARNGLLAATNGQTRWLGDCPWLWTSWRNILQIGSITLSSHVVTRLGHPIFSEDLNSGEDWEFGLHVYHLCRVVVLPEVWTQVRRFDDGTRIARPVPGKRRTPLQEVNIMKDALKIMGRYPYMSGLRPDLAKELERCRVSAASQLAKSLSLINEPSASS